jgi:uncharacterized membrane protein
MILKKRIIFNLIFSHHPPCQYNRTLRIWGNFRVCARCTGEAIGLVLTIFLVKVCNISSWEWAILAIFTPLPAIIDWSTQATEKRESNNYIRLVTGATFSFSWVIIGFLFARRDILPGLFTLAIVILEGLIAFKILWQAGIFNRVLKPFEDYEESLTSR